ncbi:MAG: glycosyltransferase family 9 protein [Bacteroidales bacterium]
MKHRFLVIQTAFIGDAILASAVLEQLHHCFPDATVDLLVRKGNHTLYQQHPYLERVLVWDKSKNKIAGLLSVIRQVRQRRYDRVINLHRFASSGLITILSKAKERAGFDKNPLSMFFDIKVRHVIGDGRHEIERNAALIADICTNEIARPRLFPALEDHTEVETYQNNDYICIAPTSVWYTKQLPLEQWVDLIDHLPEYLDVCLLGSSGDVEACEQIRLMSQNPKVKNLAGELNLLASAVLMKAAVMNYVNDSAPLHLASAMNAPVAAVFCSTVPDFGFGPLSEKQSIVQINDELYCRPCGLHGFKACPEGHFKCAKTISCEQLMEPLNYEQQDGRRN